MPAETKEKNVIMQISVYTDKRSKNKRGEMPVKVAVSHKGKRFLIGLDLTTPVELVGREYPANVPNHLTKTAALTNKVNQIEIYCLTHKDESAEEMKNGIAALLGNNPINRKGLAEYIAEFAALHTPQSAEVYGRTLRWVKQFDPKVQLDNVNRDWLMRFNIAMREAGISVNGAAIMMRNLRATFNWAIDNDWTTNYPFRKFKIERQRTRKRSLTIEQLIEIRDCACDKQLFEYRDLFMLTFYLIGINAADLLSLSRVENDGRITFNRKKTGRLYSIKVEPEAMEIIERYKGKKQLLCPLDRYASYKDYLHHWNDALKKIGKGYKEGVGWNGKAINDELTTYWARHTWATVAASLDIPKETIAHALGHAEYDTTDIYISFDERKIDEANRKVIDYVNTFGLKEVKVPKKRGRRKSDACPAA